VSLAGASLAVATAREEVAQANERRYRFQGWVAATDRCLWLLEGLNLAEVVTVPGRRLVEVRRLLATLPPRCRPELADGVRTQAALDAVFDAQERLFTLREPERPKVRVPDTFDTEEMDRWEALCEWLADQGEQLREDYEASIRDMDCYLGQLGPLDEAASLTLLFLSHLREQWSEVTPPTLPGTNPPWVLMRAALDREIERLAALVAAKG
jgi:hypothetical protein